MTSADENPYLWVLHGDNDGQPAIADWAKTEEEAEQKLSALRAEQQQNRFWSEPLSKDQAEQYKEHGLLPADA